MHIIQFFDSKCSEIKWHEIQKTLLVTARVIQEYSNFNMVFLMVIFLLPEQKEKNTFF